MPDEAKVNEGLEEIGLDKAYFRNLVSRIRPEVGFESSRTEIYCHRKIDPYSNIESESWLVEVGDLDTSDFPLRVIVKKYGLQDRPDLYRFDPGMPASPQGGRINQEAKNIGFLRFFDRVKIHDHFPEQGVLVMEHFDTDLEKELLKKEVRYRAATSQHARDQLRSQVIKELREAAMRAIEYSTVATETLEDLLKKGNRQPPFFDQVTQESTLSAFTEEALRARIQEYLHALFRNMYQEAGNPTDTNRYNQLLVRWHSDFVEPAMREIGSSRGLIPALLQKSNWVHYDLRPQHVLIKDSKRELCDFEKAGMGLWIIDPAFLFHSPLVDAFEIPVYERRGILRELGATKRQATMAQVWALLRHAGSLALLSQFQESKDKYQLLVRKSHLYDKDRVIPNALHSLEELSSNTPHLRRLHTAVAHLLELSELYGITPDSTLNKPRGLAQRLSIHIDDLPVAAMLIDPKRKMIIHANSSATDILGYNQLSDMPLANIFYHPSDFRKSFAELLETGARTSEESFRDSKGNQVRIHVRANLIENDSKHIVMVMDPEDNKLTGIIKRILGSMQIL